LPSIKKKVRNVRKKAKSTVVRRGAGVAVEAAVLVLPVNPSRVAAGGTSLAVVLLVVGDDSVSVNPND
jgi:hypothetical protein